MFKGWDVHVHRGCPGKCESSNLSRDNVSREIGRSAKGARKSQRLSEYLLYVWKGFAWATQSLQPPAPRKGTETGWSVALVNMELIIASYDRPRLTILRARRVVCSIVRGKHIYIYIYTHLHIYTCLTPLV